MGSQEGRVATQALDESNWILTTSTLPETNSKSTWITRVGRWVFLGFGLSSGAFAVSFRGVSWHLLIRWGAQWALEALTDMKIEQIELTLFLGIDDEWVTCWPVSLIIVCICSLLLIPPVPKRTIPLPNKLRKQHEYHEHAASYLSQAHSSIYFGSFTFNSKEQLSHPCYEDSLTNHPGRLTAGTWFTYSHHPWKERNRIWTKPPWLSSWWFQPHWTKISQNGNHPQIGMKIKNLWVATTQLCSSRESSRVVAVATIVWGWPSRHEVFDRPSRSKCIRKAISNNKNMNNTWGPMKRTGFPGSCLRI